MTIVTHVLATTLGVQAFELHGSEAVLAYVFGVGVDVDHAVKLPFYLRAVGLKNRRATTGAPRCRSRWRCCGSSHSAFSSEPSSRQRSSSCTWRWTTACASRRCLSIHTRRTSRVAGW